MKQAPFEITVDKMFEEIYPDYLAQLEKIGNEIADSAKNEDPSKTKLYGHQLAGNAPSYGLEELGAIGRKMEELSMSESVDFANLETSIQEYLAFVKHLNVKFE